MVTDEHHLSTSTFRPDSPSTPPLPTDSLPPRIARMDSDDSSPQQQIEAGTTAAGSLGTRPLAHHHAHPQLKKPVLYVRGGVSSAIEDAQIVEALAECLRVRPKIQRASGSRWESAQGTIEFEDLHRAEKALATVNGFRFANEDDPLRLFASDIDDNMPPHAQPRIFKLLSEELTPGDLFDICRLFGPIDRVSIAPSPSPDGSKSMLVTYYDEVHAASATKEMHLAEVGGHTITVEPYEPTFTPKGRPTRQTPPGRDLEGRRVGVSGVRGAHGNISRMVNYRAAQAVQSAPEVGRMGVPTSPKSPLSERIASWSAQSAQHAFGSSSSTFKDTHQDSIGSSPSSERGEGAGVDPRNLFIKNLDPSTTSEKLKALFDPFGNIVSARVMHDSATHRSKEFGFVSFQHPEEASAALSEMDGFALPESNKRITVRIHEPKAMREGRGRATSEAAKGVRRDDHSDALSGSATQQRTPEGGFWTPEVKASDHDRLSAAVSSLGTPPDKINQVVELLESLPKKDQKLCLFNSDVLRTKVADALDIICIPAEDGRDSGRPLEADIPLVRSNTTSTNMAPKRATTMGGIPESIALLARLPAAEIIPLLPHCASLGVKLASESTTLETDSFVDTLAGKPIHEAKQKLGERIFKAIKATGIKGAPRYTIHLLDNEELRPLAHLMAYPDILKEKVLQISAQSTK